MPFPNEFVFGATSAAYQVEGAVHEDGKGESIWDVFAHTPGAIQRGETGDVACDHYHRFEEDVQLMKSLGLQGYRFSISWPRIFPDGTGAVNQAGLDFYDRLINSLLAAGIEPFVTLYHWDMPQFLQDRGGWNNPEIVSCFARFAQTVAAHFKGRVRRYITLNEPQIFVSLGLEKGIHAPGYRLPERVCFQAAHIVVLAHFAAVRAIRSMDPDASVGFVSTGFLSIPQDESPECIQAAWERFDECPKKDVWFDHRLFCDPVVFGTYPKKLLQTGRFSKQQADEIASAFTPVDFLGLNIYNGQTVNRQGEFSGKYPGFPRSSLKWPRTPEVLYWGPKFIYRKYNLPIHITENGIAQQDVIGLDCKVHDPNRIDYMARYLRCLQKAVEEGVPVQSYFYWALTDNFEWHSGYDERFGLIYVDYRTQERHIKDSGGFYQTLIRTRNIELMIAEIQAAANEH